MNIFDETVEKLKILHYKYFSMGYEAGFDDGYQECRLDNRLDLK